MAKKETKKTTTKTKTSESVKKNRRLSFSGYLGADDAVTIHAELVDCLKTAEKTTLNLSKAEGVSTLVAQVLVIAKRTFTSDGKELSITKYSDEFKESIANLGLEKELFGDT